MPIRMRTLRKQGYVRQGFGTFTMYNNGTK